jgi:hypothetical protein
MVQTMASELHAGMNSGSTPSADAPATPAIGRAQRLGQARLRRDESTVEAAHTQEIAAAHAKRISADRWTAIVGAMRRQADAYNAGARRIILNVVEQSGEATITIAAGGEGDAPYLTATLDEGTFICASARDALGISRETEIRLCSERDDDATAAYLLQNWMEHL